MARTTKRTRKTSPSPPKEIPMTDLSEGSGPPSDTSLGDPHAAGTPAGGEEMGGLGGSNVGDGTPVPEGTVPDEEDLEEAIAYSGHAGGAVGGTPARGRSSGGNVRGGLTPESVHRGDSTIGS